MATYEDSCSVEKRFQIDRVLIKRFNDAVLEAKGTPPCNESSFLSESSTLTIQLDEDPNYFEGDPNEVVDEVDAEIRDFYDPPPSASEVRPRVADGACIKHLSQKTLEQFQIFLDLPSFGTMYNWEYLAARLGLSSNQIMNLKTQRKMTLEVLRIFSSSSVNKVLDIICDLGRVDLLISLRDFINEDNPAIPNSRSPTDSGLAESAVPSASLEVLTSASMKDSFQSLEQTSKQTYVLVVHHEKEDSYELQRKYGWFMKNLKVYAEKYKVAIYDIDDCYDEANLFGTINKIYANAKHVIFVFTEDFYDLLHDLSNSRSIKRYTYDMSNGEYAQDLRNTRFRPVVFDRSDTNVLPVGWPTNTIVYDFPVMFQKLCFRLFREEGENKS